MSDTGQKLSVALGWATLILGIVIAILSFRHGHRHTSLNGLMIAGFGFLVLMATNSDDASFFSFWIGCASVLIGVIVAGHAFIYRHPHTLKDGIGMVVGGAVLALIAYYYHKPQHVPHTRSKYGD